MEDNNVILTDEQIEKLAQAMNEVTEEDPSLKLIKDLNENSAPITTETEGEFKKATVVVDPSTGEQKIISTDESEDTTTSDLLDDINSKDIHFEIDESPIDQTELNDYISSAKDENVDSTIKDIFKDEELDEETITALLLLINRKLKKEEFNVYKEFPPKIKELVDNFLAKEMGSEFSLANSKQVKFMRNTISEALLDEFTTNINMDRLKRDFNKEIEQVFNQSASEIADEVIGYTQERNNAYREYAEKIEDPEKKEKLVAILDRIDDAYSLNELKEFCKKCKIRHIELEKPTAQSNTIDSFLRKYEGSSYNIYSIYSAEQVLARHLEDEEYTNKDIRAFFIAFCIYTQNFDVNNVFDHAFMYYTLYNIVLMDMNIGKAKNVSDVFLANIKECIANLRERNNGLK